MKFPIGSNKKTFLAKRLISAQEGSGWSTAFRQRGRAKWKYFLRYVSHCMQGPEASKASLDAE